MEDRRVLRVVPINILMHWSDKNKGIAFDFSMTAQEERRMKTTIRLILWILLIIFMPRIVVGCTWWGNKTYSGRVIDADTLEPIEGAAVVAVWNKRWPGIGAGADTRFKMAREVLTDANGEWSIRGPKGRRMTSENEWMEIFYLVFFVYYTERPSFIIYKPGYCRQAQKPGGLTAHALRDEKHGLEGIVLHRPGNTREEIQAFLDDYEHDMPFIPVKDPIAVLKSREFSYLYTDEFIRIPKRDLDFPFWVVGLKKAETWEERWHASTISVDIKADLPLLESMVKAEDRYLSKRRPRK